MQDGPRHKLGRPARLAYLANYPSAFPVEDFDSRSALYQMQVYLIAHEQRAAPLIICIGDIISMTRRCSRNPTNSVQSESMRYGCYGAMANRHEGLSSKPQSWSTCIQMDIKNGWKTPRAPIRLLSRTNGPRESYGKVVSWLTWPPPRRIRHLSLLSGSSPNWLWSSLF